MWLEEFTEEDHVGKMAMLLGRRVVARHGSSEDLECDNGRGVEMVEAKERTHILSPNPL